MHELILGTHTNNEQNYLMIAAVSLPTKVEGRSQPLKCSLNGISSHFSVINHILGAVHGHMEIEIKIAHHGEINR